ncbi:MAG: DUF4595 domain-containing protein [Prevotellaceae bacterium]|jgi:hypothetical protein|nr:DUF4595 domain-containing protein [Prevotellaceae bacterium]
MKKIFTLMIAAVMVFAGCSKDSDGGDDIGSSPIPNNTITVVVENGSSYSGQIDVVKLMMYSAAPDYEITSLSYAGGSFTVNLPASVEDKYLLGFDVPSGVTISNRNVKERPAYFEAWKSGQPVGHIYHGFGASNAGGYLLYVDGDVSITGTGARNGYSTEYRVNAKKGWNMVYESDESTGVRLITTEAPAGAKWYFLEDVESLPEEPSLPIDENGKIISRLTIVGNPDSPDEDNRRDRVIEFGYDSQNRLETLSEVFDDNDNVIRFVYAGNTVSATGIGYSEAGGSVGEGGEDGSGDVIEGPVYHGVTSVVAQLNGSGYITSATLTTVWDNDRPTDTSFHTATYDAGGYLTGAVFDYHDGDYTSHATYTFTWTAGNITRVTQTNGNYSYYSTAQYDNSPNKANLDVNWIVYDDGNFSFDEMGLFAMAGLYGKHNANLVTQTEEHSDGRYGYGYNYSYQFDSDGYVTQYTTTPSDSGRSTVHKITYR